MIQILFVISMACTILFLPGLFGNKMPFPFLHNFGITFGNTYVFTPAITFQVWWWFNHFNII